MLEPDTYVGISDSPTHQFTLHDIDDTMIALTANTNISVFGFATKFVIIHNNSLRLQENPEYIIFLPEDAELKSL
jgi:hypothetical protein